MRTTTRLRIDFAYDGAPYVGFARQTDQPTVQGALEGALSTVLGGMEVEVTCAGRTDKGVHAEAQTVHVDVPVDWKRLGDMEGVRNALDGMLGPTITIWRVRRVPDTFSARFSAVERRYRYRLWEARTMPPLLHPTTWHVAKPLDVEAMEAAGQALLGTHDFAAYCRKRIMRDGDGEEFVAHMVRRIDRVTVRRSRPSGLVLVRVEGKAFCHNMVRSITGSLVEVGRHRQSVTWIGEVLAARDRKLAGPVAPPHGLSLVGVRYTG